MSYDKYIKYKNKYLQLKAKYTQVGGNFKWAIDNVYQHGPTATTLITQQESDALNEVILKNKGHAVTIKSKELKDASNKKYDYSYTINADGITGTRSSLKGTYNMKLRYYAPPATPPPPASGASAYAPPAIRASAYAPPATPPPRASGPTLGPTLGSIYESNALDATIPLSKFNSYGATDATDYRPPRASAYAPPATPPPAPLSLQELGPLPSFMELGTVEIAGTPRYRTLTVTGSDIGELLTNDIIKKGNATFKKISDNQINMTYKGNVYPLKPTWQTYVWVYNFDYYFK